MSLASYQLLYPAILLIYIEVDGVGVEPTPLDFQSSASTELAYRPY